MPTAALSAFLIISFILLQQRTVAIKNEEGNSSTIENSSFDQRLFITTVSSEATIQLYSSMIETATPEMTSVVYSTTKTTSSISTTKNSTPDVPDMTSVLYTTIMSSTPSLTDKSISSSSSSTTPLASETIISADASNTLHKMPKIETTKTTRNSSSHPQTTIILGNSTNTGVTHRNIISPNMTVGVVPVMTMVPVNMSDNRAITQLEGVNILLPLWLLITVVVIALGLLMIVGALLLHGWLRKKKGNKFHGVAVNKNQFWSSPTQMYESQSRYQTINGPPLECSYWDTPLSTFSTQRPEPAKKIKPPGQPSFYGVEETSNHSDEENEPDYLTDKEVGKNREKKAAKEETENLLRDKSLSIV